MARALPAPASTRRTRRRPGSRCRPAPSRSAASGPGSGAAPIAGADEPADRGRAERRCAQRRPRRSPQRAAGLPRAPEARKAARGARARWAAAQRPLDWGTAEALAFGTLALEGHAGAAGRARTSGAAPSATATRCSTTTRPATPYAPLAHLARGAGHRRGPRQPPLRGGRARLRVRLQPGDARGAHDLGGAVRRLRERRPGDHRPVPRRRARPSGTGSPGWSCCCRTGWRGRGRSTRRRALERFLELSRGRQLAGREPHHAGAVLPRAPAAGACRRTASRWW